MNHFRFFSLLLACFLCGALNAQTFQTDFGWRDSPETPWDGLWPASGRPLTLLNTDQLDLSSALLTLHDGANGLTLRSLAIVKRDYYLQGRSIAAGPDVQSGVHLTGFWYKRNLFSPSTAFLLQTDAQTRPLRCFRKVTPAGYSERGMAVERLNTDVLVAGNTARLPVFLPVPSPKAVRGPAHFWAARFDQNMNLLWSFNYFSADTADFVVQEACTGYYLDQQNAKRDGFALTGYYIRKGERARHTFVSMLDAATGREIWRTSCLAAGIASDEGFDLVQSDRSGRYFVVGYAQKSSGGGRRMFSSVVEPTGVYVGSSFHEISPELGREIVARDVCMSITAPDQAVVTGYLIRPQGSIADIKTFAAELPVEPKSVAAWCVYYDLSFSDLRGSEAIVPVPEGKAGKPGYLITTGGRLYHVPLPDGDGQVLKIEPSKGLLENCPVTRFEPIPFVPEPLRPPLRFSAKRSTWKRDKLVYVEMQPFDSTCEH